MQYILVGDLNQGFPTLQSFKSCPAYPSQIDSTTHHRASVSQSPQVQRCRSRMSNEKQKQRSSLLDLEIITARLSCNISPKVLSELAKSSTEYM